MSWASGYIESLKAGNTVQFRPRGNSMRGRIESGQLCTVVPITDDTIVKIGDIVLCSASGRHYLHLVKAITGPGLNGLKMRFKIGNNLGGINGWVSRKNVYGKCIKVEP